MADGGAPAEPKAPKQAPQPGQMSQSLDEPVRGLEKVDDLKVHHREFFGGVGSFTVLKHEHLSQSTMSGSFTLTSSTGGVTEYKGCFNGNPADDGPTPNGLGVRINPDGSSFAGEWKEGFPHGQGEWKAAAPSCESYVGEWKRGKKHGYGTMKFNNGDCYEGDWADGKFQDRGKYTYSNGDEFMGLWEKGVKVSGTFYFADGRVSTRKWQGGKLVSCQEFDARKRSYMPTTTHQQVHDPRANQYGAAASMSNMITCNGVRVTT
ncbi:unnamed protein product [Durusdinium trenchii]|uniref:MORN repeat-containing protein 5 n=1 Tax=Durusdinium trenchii TaxID=1381693 RepID=A0ABP0LHH8_9DINO